MKHKIHPKYIRIQVSIVFILTLVIGLGCGHLVNRNQERKEKLKAAYTAESTVGRVEAQLNQYLSISNLLKRITESGHTLTEDEFSMLSALMLKDQPGIEAIEMAKDGIVTQVYPVDGNEEALGLNMLKHPERKKEANLAKESGQYTIAGPFSLVQTDTGALLFDPIYTQKKHDAKHFWGFSILVINWDRFIDEINPDSLLDASYCYRIRKNNVSTGKKVTIAQCDNDMPQNTLKVTCKVPNDTWYFEIVPKGGWSSKSLLILEVFIPILLSLLVTIGYWQYELRRYRDIVYTQEIEHSSKKAQAANEAKTRFLFNMSHDVRTPMNAIIGFSDLLEQNIDDKEKLKEYIAKIRSSSSFLLSLINCVLENARIESGHATLKADTVSLSALLSSLKAVFEPSIREKELTPNYHVRIYHDRVICDETKVKEILLNIVSNAIKYTPNGGHVSVIITEYPCSREGFASYTAVIEDDGIGMSEEYLPHIFEEFSREHTSTESKVFGAGLGLPIVKTLIELMHGTIAVQSIPNKGTTFTITLSFPIASEAFTEDKDSTESESKEDLSAFFQGKHILLTEDNDINAEIAINLLENAKFIVDRAKDGLDCIKQLQSKPENYYDAILMDVQMPNMDGYETTRLIRARTDNRRLIPIIAMTANAFDEDRKKALDVGMNGHIAKPLDIKGMFATLYDILNKQD